MERYPQTFDPADYVCTRDPATGAGTGGGDSGGPLVSGGKLIGVTVSGTFGLDANYASFTEVGIFADEASMHLDS